jgi:hypothetical protein
LRRFTQSLRFCCTTLRNKNNPTLQFLQEFSRSKIYFLLFAQQPASFFVENIESEQRVRLHDLRKLVRKSLTLRANRFTIDLLHQGGTDYGSYHQGCGSGGGGIALHSVPHLQGQPFHQPGNQGAGAPHYGTAGL